MQRLGKYEIISEIGRGAMGAVYKARDPFIERLVALKTITSGLGAHANSLERFYQEARSAGALQHPHIVTIYELGHEDKTPFIAMEYIEGESLDHVIEHRRPLPLSVKLGYMVRVCEALSFAHRHNVIHRDIKPGNVMVSKDGVVKVVDFGIARLTDMSMTQPNTMIGSRAYMSPQLYKGERADARADIWAVGVTLYELIKYQRPFNGDTEAELMFHILSDPPPALRLDDAECTEELSQIIHRMLEKKAEDRYQSMDDVLRDFEPLWKTAQQATVAGLLADSQQLVAVNDLQRAQGLLRKALQIDLGNTRVKSLLDKVTSELRRTQVLPKVNEHLERSKGFLQSGKLGEARAEVQVALGLDSRHEAAQRLFKEVEAASARAQEVEQKLRLTKQRLAEGALTEAASALSLALELDNNNAEAKELRRQIDEESNRRERRKKLSEVLHHARTLWTTLDYDGCLKVISDALRDFPDDPELLKMRQMARHDLEDLDKQRQLAETRKLLGQLEFTGARKIIDALANKYPQDSAVKNLQTLVLDAEREQQKSKRFIDELAGLRSLLSTGKYADAVTRGTALLREYPEEFELRELLEYARGEQARQDAGQKEKAYEEEIRELIAAKRYRDAELAARRAAQEFPKLELFRGLTQMIKRIREIDKHVQDGKISDAIQLGEQTFGQIAPDSGLTQLLNAVTIKPEQLKKREQEQQQQFAAAKTMVEAGNFAGATQVLNHALATQIFEPSDPRVKQQLQEIDQLSRQASGKTAAWTSAKDKPRVASGNTPPMFAGPVGGGAGAAVRPAREASTPMPRSDSSKHAVHEVAERGQASETATANSGKGFAAVVRPFAAKTLDVLQVAAKSVRKPAVFGSIAAVALIVAVTIAIVHPRKSSAENGKEIVLRDRASQLWAAHQLDESEQAWRELQDLHGGLQKEASQQIGDIEEKRLKEQQRFDQGMQLKATDVEGAKAAFQEVETMNLWHAEDAKREYAALIVPPPPVTDDPGIQEKAHFDRGEQFFASKNYDLARREFLVVRELNVANSTIRPEADKYLRRIKQNVDDKNTFDSAVQDIKNESWAEARNKLQQLIAHKALLSADANQKLGEVSEAEKAENEVAKSLQNESYSAARTQIEAMTLWPKTKAALTQKLQTAQRKQLDDLESRANALIEKGDADGLERIEDELRIFGTRAEDATVKEAVQRYDQGLRPAIDRFRDDPEARKAFEAAVADFTKSKHDRDALEHRVKQEFQALAAKKGRWQAPALAYVNTTIPNAIAELGKVPAGKIQVPPLSCTGGGLSGGAADPSLTTVPCAQLDAGSSLQWNETYLLDFPESANQAGKLPYTLKLMVTVDPIGKVKVDKDGNVDKDFFKKARDASKNWKATPPKSGGKPVSVRFPLAITFQRD